MRKLTAIFVVSAFTIFFLSLFSIGVFAFELNPGCDSDVRSSGVDTISDHFLVDPAYQTMLTKGAKWWMYDVRPNNGAGGFVQGGNDTSDIFLAHLPGCFNNGSFEINPGCDSEVKATGVDIINHQSFVESNQVLLTKGTKWWVYDAYVYEWAGAFIDGGEDITPLFVGTSPSCYNNGSFELNPGCDADVKASGFEIITHQNLVGLNQVLLTKGTKWWVYDATMYGWTGAFVDGGEDLASFLKDKAYYNGVYTPDCFNNGSFELNPGCDSDVQSSGLDAISDYFLVDPLYQAILTKGTKWWIYDTRIGGSGGYVEGGDDLDSLLMTYLPACNVTICFADEECGIDGYIGNYFCENNDVHRNYIYYNCTNPGTINSSCESHVFSDLIDDCEAYEYCTPGNSTCQFGQIPTTTTQPSAPSGPPGAPPLIEDEIENKLEELYQEGATGGTADDISNILTGLESIESSITNPELMKKLEDIEARILEIQRYIEAFENQIKSRSFIYRIKWFFGLAAEQERADAQFLESKAKELLDITDALKSLASDLEDDYTRDAVIEETARLRLQANELNGKAEQKRKNAYGLFSWIKSFISWVSKLFSRK